MKKLLAAALLAVLTTGHAYADWDYEMEAREKAARDAEAREQAAKEAEAAKIAKAAHDKANAGIMAEKRKYVGAAANGKSDAEVTRLYDEKQARETKKAYAEAAEVRRKLDEPQAKAASREVTGYTMEEMSKMSDAELEALSREMEKKYGGGQ